MEYGGISETPMYQGARTVTLTSTVTLTPAYFQQQAQAYNANTDRAAWLRGQITQLEASLKQYAAAIQEVMQKGAELDGQSSAANWMKTIGGVAIAIPNPYTAIGGAVLAIAGSIVGASKRKKDSRALQELAGKAEAIQRDALQIQSYYDSYRKELNSLQTTPLLLGAAIAYVLLT